MKVLVTGSTGLIGTALVPSLSAAGHRVIRLVRRKPGIPETEIHWDPEAGTIDTAAIEGLDGVVHLAGENIGNRRWTDKVKSRIRYSRVRGTHLLCDSLAGLTRPPATLVCASAMGYYGDRGEETLIEESPGGSDFLAEVCRDWEAAAEPAVQKGIRVVHLRFGMILSRTGGALERMLLPFRLGLGGRLGSGKQYMSWIALDDAVGIIRYALDNETLRGPINAATPHPVTNQEFTRILGKVLGRPTFLPVPILALHLAFGEMANVLLLASTRLKPKRLLETGYTFLYPELEGTLQHLLK